MVTSITYSDISLVPREKSTIESRDNVDPSTDFLGRTIASPLIISPMRTVCGIEMARALVEKGHFAWLPRNSNQEFTNDFMALLREGQNKLLGVALGVHNILEEFEFFSTAGVEVFCIDVANGFHANVERAVKSIQDSKYFDENIKLITGVVASWQGYNFLSSLGVDAVRVGLGGGAPCSTSVATGVGQGAPATLLDTYCNYSQLGSKKAKIIADGGIKEPGDVVKALALGADYVFAGSVFAGTAEAPGTVIKYQGQKYKVYAGEASHLVAQRKYEEGVDTLVPYKGPVEKVLWQYEAGLRSAMSYMNYPTIADFKNTRGDEIVRLSPAARIERTPHILR